MIVNQVVLADVIGVTCETLKQWQKVGLPCRERGAKGKEAKFDTAAVIAWLIAREGADPADAKVSAQRERLLRAQADAAELAHKQKLGTLVKAADVNRGAYEKARVLRDRLLMFPDRQAQVITAAAIAEGAAKVHELLRAEILSILRELGGKGKADGDETT